MGCPTYQALSQWRMDNLHGLVEGWDLSLQGQDPSIHCHPTYRFNDIQIPTILQLSKLSRWQNEFAKPFHSMIYWPHSLSLSLSLSHLANPAVATVCFSRCISASSSSSNPSMAELAWPLEYAFTKVREPAASFLKH